jgi:16S rRNA (cytidine1402-2'-O)-methyltransferase
MGSGVVYLVGTPIGNLGDMGDRARETLAAVDLVVAEDTRRTGRLLQHFGIRPTKMLSFFEGNELMESLEGGAQVALVSDSGMPGLSDPGFRLVRACAERGVDVRVVPGPSAAIAALVVSGLPTDRFSFEGFLPRTARDRRARLEALAGDPRTVVVFESARRVGRLIEEALAELGDRRAALVRELTKVHEAVWRGSLSDLLTRVRDGEPRGEVVLVVGGAGPVAAGDTAELLPQVARLVAEGARPRDAAAQVARASGAGTNEVYRAWLSSKGSGEKTRG